MMVPQTEKQSREKRAPLSSSDVRKMEKVERNTETQNTERNTEYGKGGG